MKSLILYSGPKRASSYPISVYDGDTRYTTWVRVELFDGNISDALDNANPNQEIGEVVLNTIEAKKE